MISRISRQWIRRGLTTARTKDPRRQSPLWEWAPRVHAFLVEERGLQESQAAGVAQALEDAGAGGSEAALEKAVRVMDEAAMQALLNAVDAESNDEDGRPAASVLVHVPHERHDFEVQGRDGDSLFDLVRRRTLLSDYLECACQGQMMCSTCHVYVDARTLERLPPPEDAELDMLDLAFECKENSRLGCQLRLSADAASMTEVTVPEKANNFYN